jgi:hypothetical protein
MEVRVPFGTVRAQLLSAGFSGLADHALLPYHYFLTASA